MTPKLQQRHYKNLEKVHPKLAAIVAEAQIICEIEFVCIEGLRTIERQEQLVASGASKTLKSRHLTGHAVDLAAVVGNEIRWDWPLYATIAQAMKKASGRLGIPIEWGGDWKTFKDGPHFQLPWKQFPA